MTLAMTPARIQTSREAGPTRRAPIAVATYTSAPMIDPTTRLVTSKVLSRWPGAPVSTDIVRMLEPACEDRLIRYPSHSRRIVRSEADLIIGASCRLVQTRQGRPTPV